MQSSVSTSQNLSAWELIKEVEDSQQDLDKLQIEHAKKMLNSKSTLEKFHTTVNEYEKQQKIAQIHFLGLELGISNLSTTTRAIKERQGEIDAEPLAIFSQIKDLSGQVRSLTTKNLKHQTVLRKTHALICLTQLQSAKQKSRETSAQSIEYRERLELQNKLKRLEAENRTLKTENSKLKKENGVLKVKQAEKRDLIDSVRKSANSMRSLRDDLRGFVTGVQDQATGIGATVQNLQNLEDQEKRQSEDREAAFKKNQQNLEKAVEEIKGASKESRKTAVALGKLATLGLSTSIKV